MPLLGSHIKRLGFCGRTVAECQRNVVAEDNLLILRCQSQVLPQPRHLLIGKLTRRIIGAVLGELHVIEAHIMLIATVERIVGRPPAILPFALIQGTAVLVMIADNGEKAHL